MEVAVVAEAEEIQLQALALHHFHVGDVFDDDLAEVGLSGNRTEGCELGAVKLHPIVVLLVLVLEGLEDARVVGLRIAHPLVAQKRQVVGPLALRFLVRRVRRVHRARHVRHAIPPLPRLLPPAQRRACRAADRASRSPRTHGCGRCTSRTHRKGSRHPRSSSR